MTERSREPNGPAELRAVAVPPVSCIQFSNQESSNLVGMLHQPPPGSALGVCVLLLSPGIKGRVGPHRIYSKIAAPLVKSGFHVLRFDFHGLGDSEGAVPERALADVYNAILSGRYVGDTVAAMDWMQQQHGVRRFVGSGLCGGSITALLTAERDERIECLFGIGLPTALEGGSENWGRVLTQYELSVLRGQYLRKLMDPKSWLRMLSGRSSYKVIWQAMRQRLTGQAGAKPRQAGGAVVAGNTNPRFASAFFSMLHSSRPMLLVFSQADRLRYEFGEHFEAVHASRIAPVRQLYDVHVIPHANHVMSDAAWVQELATVGVDWLARHFAPSQAR